MTEAAEAEAAAELKVFVAVGECEAHWIIAADRAAAGRVMADWVSSEWSDEEKLDFERWGHEWMWTTLGPDDDLSEETDAGWVTKPVRQWIAEHGPGHLSWSEVG